MNFMRLLRVSPGRLALLLLPALFAGCAGLNKPDEATAPAGAKGYVWSKAMEARRVSMETATRGSGVSVRRTKDNQLQMNVPSDFSFDAGSALVKPGMRPVLDQFAQDLDLPAFAHMLILIVGHTDDRGPNADNDTLSLARADNVRKHFESKGIVGTRIAIEGHGQREPVIGNEMAAARALNRRVEVYLREPGT